MSFSGIREKVNENIGVVIGMVSVLIMAGMTVAEQGRESYLVRNQHFSQPNTSSYNRLNIPRNLFLDLDGQAVLNFRAGCFE